jgi:hypothetical protein
VITVDCSCTYCYHQVCFHPLRGDEATIGIPCDGCTLDDIPTLVTEEYEPLLLPAPNVEIIAQPS